MNGMGKTQPAEVEENAFGVGFWGEGMEICDNVKIVI